jgi:hypothetical protein
MPKYRNKVVIYGYIDTEADSAEQAALDMLDMGYEECMKAFVPEEVDTDADEFPEEV